MRFPIIVMCIGLIPGFAFAIPRPTANFAHKGDAIPVQEETSWPPRPPTHDADRPWRYSDDCRRHENDCPPPYQRRTVGRDAGKRPVASPKRKDGQAEFAAKQIARKIANGALSDLRGPHKEVPSPRSRPVGAGPSGRAAPSLGTSEDRVKAMIGQLLLSGFEGKHPEDHDAARAESALRDGKISGIVIGDSNISSPTQLHELLSFFAKGGSTPPIIAIDQPGGPDSPLSEDKGFAFYASANAVGGELSATDAQRVYRDMALELASIGVTLNIGPSIDRCRQDGVDLSASCFGSMPSRVAALAWGFSEGHHAMGVLTALRHEPFRSGVQSFAHWRYARGALLWRLAAREIGDAVVVKVKATGPGSLPETPFGSARANLYREPGFTGVLIFDLDMGNPSAPIRQDEVILRAFRAGADMVLIRDATGLRADLLSTAYEAVRRGLQSGRLRMARLEEAYRRVQRLKERLPPLQLEARFGREGRAFASK